MDFKKIFFAVWGGGRAKTLFFLSLGFLIVVGLASYFKTDGIRTVFNSDRKLSEKMEDLKKVEAQNAALKEKIKSVQEGSYLMEKYARERLLMSKKDDMVFRFREAPGGAGQAEK